MDIKRLLIVIGIGLVLILVMTVAVRMLTRDNQPLFDDILAAQSTTIQLSEQATKNADQASIAALATSMLSTINSDRNKLLDHYHALYGSRLSPADETALLALKEAEENFDSIYRELALEQLEAIDTNLNQLSISTTDTNLLEIIEQARTNSQHYIAQLTAINQ